MDYARILNRSFAIAWKYKSLWIFGMFVGGGIPNFNFEMQSPRQFDFQSGEIPDFSNMGLGDWFGIPPELIKMFFLSMAALMLVLIMASLISKGALIDAINKIERGGRYRFGEAFSAGIDYFLRFLGILILTIFSVCAAILVFVFAMVVTFKIHTAIGVLSLIPGIVAIIFVCFFLISMFGLAQRVVVVRNASIGDALEEAYFLVRKNLGKVAIIALIFLGFIIGFWIVAMIIWAMFALPITALGLIANMDAISAIFAGILIGLPISLVVGGFLGVFFTSVITLFYFELVEPSQPQMQQIPPAAAPMA